MSTSEAAYIPELVPLPPDPLAGPDLPAEAFEHGRGLRLVGALADDWGHAAEDGGRTVHAGFTLPGEAGQPHRDHAAGAA